MTQSIIVYRNPFEQLFWESLMSPLGGLVILTVICFLILAVWLSKPFNWIRKRFKFGRQFLPHAELCVAAVICGFIFWKVSFMI